MTPAARLSAAIEVFADIEARRRPAADALKDWGLVASFCRLVGDRAAIAGLVYDALRRKSSSAWLMGEATPRAVLIGMLHRERGLDVAAIEALCSGARFAPAPLTEAERAALTGDRLASAPAPVPAIIRTGSIRILRACSARNGRRGRRAGKPGAARHARQHAQGRARRGAAESCASSRRADAMVAASGCAFGLRPTRKVPAIHAEPLFRKGAIEIQDEGSQLAALFAGAKPGEQVHRSCRRRRRQDPRAGRRDGKSRPDLRDRYRQAPARADSRAHCSRRRAQHPGSHAERRGAT